MIHSAKVASLVKRAAEFGISTGPARIEMAGVFSRKRQMVEELISEHLRHYHDSGAELIMGEARFTAPNTVQVTLQSGGVRMVRGTRVFIDVGTRASLPSIPGLAEAKPMTHVEALNLQRLPEHLIVFGGGYVGVEFAQALRRFGSHVTIIQRGEHLLSREDADVSTALQQILEREGVTILLQSQVAEVKGVSGEHLRVEVTRAGERMTLEATDLLAALGRTPNTDCLDADRANIQLDEAGYIRVNERLETTAPNTWALGECAGTPKFTHAVHDDFRIVHANLTGGNRNTRDRLIPYCIFSDPELARVGLSEREARRKGISYRLATLPMRAVLRTFTTSEPAGFLKALVGTDDRILGFAALGAEASEFLAAVQTAMIAGMPYQTLRDAIFPHPTMAEGFGSLFANLTSAT